MTYWLKSNAKLCRCGATATVVLFRAVNIELGEWCSSCGLEELLRRRKLEESDTTANGVGE